MDTEDEQLRSKAAELADEERATFIHQPPEGRALAHARKRHKPRLSARAAAALAEMSETRWRQIEKGYQSIGAGETAAVRAPAETLARMALAVGMTSEELLREGREDAADVMEEWADREAAREHVSRSGSNSPTIADATLEELLSEIARRAGGRGE